MFANYLCELSLHEYCFTKYYPSVVAAAAVCLSLHMLTKGACWSSTLEFYTHLRMTDENLRLCIIDMQTHHKQAPKASLQAVQDKYSQAKFGKVSEHKIIPPSVTLPFSL